MSDGSEHKGVVWIALVALTAVSGLTTYLWNIENHRRASRDFHQVARQVEGLSGRVEQLHKTLAQAAKRSDSNPVRRLIAEHGGHGGQARDEFIAEATKGTGTLSELVDAGQAEVAASLVEYLLECDRDLGVRHLMSLNPTIAAAIIAAMPVASTVSIRLMLQSELSGDHAARSAGSLHVGKVLKELPLNVAGGILTAVAAQNVSEAVLLFELTELDGVHHYLRAMAPDAAARVLAGLGLTLSGVGLDAMWQSAPRAVIRVLDAFGGVADAAARLERMSVVPQVIANVPAEIAAGWIRHMRPQSAAQALRDMVTELEDGPEHVAAVLRALASRPLATALLAKVEALDSPVEPGSVRAVLAGLGWHPELRKWPSRSAASTVRGAASLHRMAAHRRALQAVLDPDRRPSAPRLRALWAEFGSMVWLWCLVWLAQRRATPEHKAHREIVMLRATCILAALSTDRGSLLPSRRQPPADSRCWQLAHATCGISHERTKYYTQPDTTRHPTRLPRHRPANPCTDPAHLSEQMAGVCEMERVGSRHRRRRHPTGEPLQH